MAITLLTMRTNVRSLLDEPNPQFWQNSELNNWINEAASEIARKVEWKRAVVNIDTDAEVQNYVGPTDMYRIYRLTWQQDGGTDTYTVEWRGMFEMDQIWGINQQWPGSEPLYYTTWKVPPTLQITLYPVPAADGNLTAYYYQQATPAVADGDDVDALEGWEDACEDYCCYRALRKDADPRWKEFKDTYEDKLIAMVDATRTFQDQAGTFTTGQQALPIWLVSDGIY